MKNRGEGKRMASSSGEWFLAIFPNKIHKQHYTKPGHNSDGEGKKIQQSTKSRATVCYLWEDIEISNIEEGRALNSWLIGL